MNSGFPNSTCWWWGFLPVFRSYYCISSYSVYASLDGDANSNGNLSLFLYLNEVVRASWVFFSMKNGQPDPSTPLIVYVLYATNPPGIINIDWRHKMDGILLAGPGPGNTLHFSDEFKTTHNGDRCFKNGFWWWFFSSFWFFSICCPFLPLALSGIVKWYGEFSKKKKKVVFTFCLLCLPDFCPVDTFKLLIKMPIFIFN